MASSDDCLHSTDDVALFQGLSCFVSSQPPGDVVHEVCKSGSQFTLTCQFDRPEHYVLHIEVVNTKAVEKAMAKSASENTRNVIGLEVDGVSLFHNSHEICIIDDLLYIADFSNSRIQIFNIHGDFVRDIRDVESGKRLWHPYGICTNGLILFVSEFRNCTIHHHRSAYVFDWQERQQ
jgi:hypothetical protein